MKNLCAILVTLLLLVAVGCGGNTSASNSTASTSASVQGSWEFTFTSTALPNSENFLDANLSQNGNTISAANSQLVLFSVFNSAVQVGGNCGSNLSVGGSLSGNSIQGTFTEGNTNFGFNGTLSSDGKTITGTYIGTSASCSDNGNFTAHRTSPLNLTASGTLLFEDSTTNGISVNMTEDSSEHVTISGNVSGPDVGTINLTGVAVGNVGIVNGTVGGQPANVDFWLAPTGQIFVADDDTGFILGFLTKN